ncbi:putative maltose O-acetyltransferase [Parachaetomium inaequale]|uniref:Maltose O-acetyltransferase n=1 Tax=Parachaetomium inaequale TaxID=2588326 RepID=A0AAN6SRP7_9PEZI|nr:putative maltose O-acetyltransferase [Parachaetomium inaequale]
MPKGIAVEFLFSLVHESTIAITLEEPESTYFPRVIFPASNSDFHIVRNRCTRNIVYLDREYTEDSVLGLTYNQTFANLALKAKTLFVKPPVYVDYNTPVADVIIDEGCNIGLNCSIVRVTHPVRLDERFQRHSIGQPVTIGNNI